MIVSYCTTCMGRLWQLRQTLPKHLELFRGRDDVEFVVLDYNSPDGLQRWVAENRYAREAIDRGLLLYAKEHTATVFNSSKAKNLAHRIAKGEILVNLDADNWADDIDQPLRQAFAATNRTIFRAWNGKRDGSSGRIAIASTWFYGLGGYDESFYPVGYQDVDLVLRAVAAGLKKHSFTAGRTPIRNSARAKIISTGLSCGLPSMLKANRLLSAANLAKGDPIRNREGWGAGFVSVNFAPVSRLVPIRPVALTANQNSIESRGVDNPRFDCRMRSDRDIDRAIEIVRRQRR